MGRNDPCPCNSGRSF
ncbi:SEC-C metal-binding domain-containing protein [Snodgrassella alvi]